jgi:Rrf2 family iron-sulfur cluster assembly transcriptional regulator
MNLLSSRSMLGIAAVVDISLHGSIKPVTAKSIAASFSLPPRHFDVLPRGLADAKILRGVRGPRGGYQLGRDAFSLSAGDIVRAVLAISKTGPGELGMASSLVKQVIEPPVRRAEDIFLASLDALTVSELCASATPLE